MNEVEKNITCLPDHDENTEKILNYVSYTSFFEHLRNHYHSFRQMSKNQVKSILKSGEVLRVSEEKNMLISFNQPTVCIVIYGDIFVEGKRYTIGKFFIIGSVKIDICFKEKSLLVMFHKDSIENQMQKFEDYHFKKKLLEKLLPADLLKLSKSQLKSIIDGCIFKTAYADEFIVKLDSKEYGLVLLLDGTFSILSKVKLKITEINFDYFGEEILWEKEYEYSLVAESVECRYIFISREILLAVLNQNNLKVLKSAYSKRSQARRSLEVSLTENINYTKDFMKRLNLNKKSPAIVNPEYRIPLDKSKKNPKKELKFQNLKLSHKINSSRKFIHYRKMTTTTNLESSQQHMKSTYEDSTISKETNFNPFEPKMYKDQNAKSKLIFRKRVKSQAGDKSQSRERFIKQDRVAQKDLQNLKNLPKTLSVLLKYYQSTERLRPRPKTVSVHSRDGFVSCSKERRLMTTMKLHKQIFMREYFEIKSLQDKAFKTWR